MVEDTTNPLPTEEADTKDKEEEEVGTINQLNNMEEVGTNSLNMDQVDTTKLHILNTDTDTDLPTLTQELGIGLQLKVMTMVMAIVVTAMVTGSCSTSTMDINLHIHTEVTPRLVAVMEKLVPRHTEEVLKLKDLTDHLLTEHQNGTGHPHPHLLITAPQVMEEVVDTNLHIMEDTVTNSHPHTPCLHSVP